jgi:hypothetical protein
MKVEPMTAGGITYVAFKCPGCNTLHQIQTPRWTWNESLDRPTFTPSILVMWEANPDAIEGFEEWRKARRCHSFVTDGRIQFLSDCTHALANQTVDLPELD